MPFRHISELQMKNAIFTCVQMSLFTYPLQPHFQAQIGTARIFGNSRDFGVQRKEAWSFEVPATAYDNQACRRTYSKVYSLSQVGTF